MRAIVLGVGLALAPSAALAADLSTLVESFVIERSGADGSPGAQARGVAIDSQGRTVVVGWIHGEDAHAEDAWLERFTGDGTSDLEVLVDGGPVDADRVSSRDRFFDVAVDSADAIAVSGALSADGWEASFYVAKLDADGEVLWDDHFRDGAEVDEVGCAPGQGLAPADDGPDDAAASPDPGCGCAAVGPVGSWPLLLLALLAVGRRRAA